MTDSKPYWTMSRLDLQSFGRYDWLYRHPAPQPKIKPKTALAKKQQPPSTSQTMKSTDPADDIELVGYKPSEYKSVPVRPPLRGMTAPVENGRRDVFNDMHTPIQITKRFNGSPIISVPISNTTRKTIPRRLLKSRRENEEDVALPIHDVLFEESVDPHEDIDPWGFSRDEKVVAPDKTFHGMKLTVSRLHPPKK
ncbi:hypothetical protein TRFO_11212 [Tritrichomonas foetus]|uniref:Uncharacterized protein n=1 Tax=Tritrichomonas foetus TaxID=1144522 RepID=A0A1J4JA75_9EUKA|nr:hypothetical protein TRFO_11212 [Tritrichomonas foetus]|eukprot:OHS94349.1 hypothetical protein TRFO_11212 [Tritrichomonas foetus]